MSFHRCKSSRSYAPIRNPTEQKVPVLRVLRLPCGAEVIQGALTPDALRRAAGMVEAADQARREELPRVPAVLTDDTGPNVGGHHAWPSTFTTP